MKNPDSVDCAADIAEIMRSLPLWAPAHSGSERAFEPSLHHVKEAAKVALASFNH